MVAQAISAKQIRLLKVLRERDTMIARWDHGDLAWLARRGFVKGQHSYTTSGRLSAQYIWLLDERGRAFLEEERAGQ
ncbi:hypothetical protein [Sphingobium lignivorans]|uniref:Phage antirepressor protein KilAC domain-containing protein n=1 Tax=Sphingobium lignivorans TaxID=2735886 RepID=A0ABR6NL53_9SPHN|nr:hypothetical protein [Sphingobium lignivorans]MBB5987397.1 hypothetical protein [Sphingobium lignivorans]